MCWNEIVSLNTFVFSSATLLFIWYNHTYTQYKLSEFDNPYFYFVLLSVTTMQLIEYFLWKSIHTRNKELDKITSFFGLILIRVCQPLALLLVIPKAYEMIQKILFVLYFSLLIIVYTYKYFYNPLEFKTVVDNKGSLLWKWGYLNGYERILFMVHLFICLTLFLSYPLVASVIAIYLVYTVYVYKYSFGSMWCWITNTLLIYFLFKLLILLPYQERNKLC